MGVLSPRTVRGGPHDVARAAAAAVALGHRASSAAPAHGSVQLRMDREGAAVGGDPVLVSVVPEEEAGVSCWGYPTRRSISAKAAEIQKRGVEGVALACSSVLEVVRNTLAIGL